MKMKIFTIKTRSGLHCGIGQGLGDIDLPTARESVTGYPFIPGSSLKGVLRDRFENGNDPRFEAAFGKNDPKKVEFASAVSFGDGRLLCLPVRSYFGTFAWMTSPLILGQVRESLLRMGQKAPDLPMVSSDTSNYKATIPPGSALLGNTKKDRVLLEDLDLLLEEKLSAKALVWAELISGWVYPGDEQGATLFKKRFIVVDDNVMAFFCETSLPVATRIRIGENGTVEAGALWYEEFVPNETLFWGHIVADNGKGPHRNLQADDLLTYICAEPIECQVGGDATVGRGDVCVRFA